MSDLWDRFRMAVSFPLLAVLVIAIFAGGLGIIFMTLYKAMGEISVIALGLLLVLGVPTGAALIERSFQE